MVRSATGQAGGKMTRQWGAKKQLRDRPSACCAYQQRARRYKLASRGQSPPPFLRRKKVGRPGALTH